MRKNEIGWMCVRGMLLSCFLLLCFCTPAKAGTMPAEYARAEIRMNCALASVASYSGDLNQTVAKMLEFRDWEVYRYREDSAAAQTKYTLFRTSLQGREDPLWLLAIAGTESGKDAEVDLRIHRVAFGGNTPEEFRRVVSMHPEDMPMVHQGFNEYTQTAFFENPISPEDPRTFGELLADELKARPGEKLYLTGHSLGGAVAVLAAARLVDMGVPGEQIEVITFGAPAVGSEAFARAYEQKISVERIVMPGDPVKGVLQSVNSGYVQFGETKELSKLKGSERFSHEMVLYLDGIMRDYIDTVTELEKRGVNMDFLNEKPRYQAKVYAAPVEFELAESVRPVQPYVEKMMRLQMLDDFNQPLLGEKQDMSQTLPALCKSAKQAGCDYVIVRSLEGEKVRFAKNEFRFTMEEAVYDVFGTLMNMYSASTTTRNMTPLEAAVYVYENGDDMRDRVFREADPESGK